VVANRPYPPVSAPTSSRRASLCQVTTSMVPRSMQPPPNSLRMADQDCCGLLSGWMCGAAAVRCHPRRRPVHRRHARPCHHRPVTRHGRPPPYQHRRHHHPDRRLPLHNHTRSRKDLDPQVLTIPRHCRRKRPYSRRARCALSNLAGRQHRVGGKRAACFRLCRMPRDALQRRRRHNRTGHGAMPGARAFPG
jgi:hypothetical protein